VSAPAKLHKTTIVIWSDEDPSDMEIDDLAREAVSGSSFCSKRVDEVVTDRDQFPDTEFFGVEEDDDDEEEDDEESTPGLEYYSVHFGDESYAGDPLHGRWWWCVCMPRCDIESSDGDFDTEEEAWADAARDAASRNEDVSGAACPDCNGAGMRDLTPTTSLACGSCGGAGVTP
jgi:hypothetical protein